MTTLFDNIPAAASADPRTSHQAAAEITESGVRLFNVRRVAELAARFPSRTSRELAATTGAVDYGLDRYECARRLPEAEKLGLVRRGPQRKCRESWRAAIVWLPVDGSTAFNGGLES